MVSTTLTTIAAAGQNTTGINNLHQNSTPERAPTSTQETANLLRYQQRATASQHQQQYQQQPRQHAQLASPITAVATSTSGNTQNNIYCSVEANEVEVKPASKIKSNLTDTCEYNHNNSSINNITHRRHCHDSLAGNEENPKHESTSVPQTLLSASSPINDQISLLFPKCKPKYTSNTNSSNNSNRTAIPYSNCTDSTDVNKPLRKENYTDKSFKARLKLFNGNELSHESETDVINATTNNYYRSVNLITQSPPPHSTSSISSGSLSSVTPRISTNPFLCSSSTIKKEKKDETDTKEVKNETIAKERRKAQDEVEDLTNYCTLFQHGLDSPSSKTQRHLSGEGRQIQGDDMPRKRSSYERCHNAQTSTTTTTSSNNQIYLQEKSYGSRPKSQQTSTAAVQQSDHQIGQNPFTKDNYWETRQHNTPANAILNSPDYSGNGVSEMENRNSQKRSFHHQPATYTGRHQPPITAHHIRLGRSPNSSDKEQPDAIQKRNNYNTQQSQTQTQIQKSNPGCTEHNFSSIASHYLYGSNTSLHEQYQMEKSDRRERELQDRERDRDREQREQRSKILHAERERYTTAALIRESMSEQTALEIRERRERQFHQKHQLHQQKHQKQQQRQLTEEQLLAHNEVITDDKAKSWQNLRVSTDPHTQVNNRTTTLAPDTIDITDTSVAFVKSNQKRNTIDGKDVDIQKSTTIINSGELQQLSHKKYRDGDYEINVESRHGIIEYEGSPRRIGQMIGNATDDEHGRVSNGVTPLSSSSKTNHSITVSSPKQYAARPGFPQRIISPPRDTTPPIMLLNYNANNKLQQQQQKQQHQQQTNSQQTLTDNNAEDTSNDVSEIGTISDLTTPDNNISATNTLGAVSIAGGGCGGGAGGAGGAGGGINEVLEPISSPKAIKEITTTITAITTIANSTAPAVNSSNTPTSTSLATLLNVTTSTTSSNPLSIPTKSTTFDYLYEFSETRKVLEEFFKCPSNEDKPIIENISDVDSIDIQYEFHTNLGRDIEDDDHIEGGDVNLEDEDGDDDGMDENDEDEEQLDVNNEDSNIQLRIPQQQHQQQQQHQLQQEQPHRLPAQVTHYPNHQRNHVQSPTQHSYQYYGDINGRTENDIDDAEGDDDDEADVDDDIENNDDDVEHHEDYQHCQQEIQQQPDNHYHSHSHSHQHNQFTMNNRYARHTARRHFTSSPLMRDFDFFLDSASRSSGEQFDHQDSINHNHQSNNTNNARHNYRYSPDTTDYDSNCGDLDSLSGELNGVSTSCSNYTKYYASSMPVLEDGLSSGHTSDTENNNNNQNNHLLSQQNSVIQHTPVNGGISILMDMKRASTNNSINSMNNITTSTTDGGGGGGGGCGEKHNALSPNIVHRNHSPIVLEDTARDSSRGKQESRELRETREREFIAQSPSRMSTNQVFKNIDPDLDSLYSISVFQRNDMVQMTPPPPAPAPHRKPNVMSTDTETLQSSSYRGEIRTNINHSNSPSKSNSITLSTHNNAMQANASPTQSSQKRNNSAQPPQPPPQPPPPPPPIPERNIQRSPSPLLNSPVWLSRHLEVNTCKTLLESSSENHSKNLSTDEDEVDTDLETDRLLGHQRLDDQSYYEENKSWVDRKPARSLLSKISPKQVPSTKTRNGYNALLSSTPEIPPPIPPKNSSNKLLDIGGSISSPEHSDKSPIKSIDIQDCVVTMGSAGDSDNSDCLKKDCDSSGPGPNNGNNSSSNISAGNNSTGNACNAISSNNDSVASVNNVNVTTGEKKVKKSKNKEGKLLGLSS
uniref:Uncharacterized protein n=1 Tax=Glossina palpalis gambiensis TaxID=67801 RepID=A0A1B0APN4_9MUSC